MFIQHKISTLDQGANPLHILELDLQTSLSSTSQSSTTQDSLLNKFSNDLVSVLLGCSKSEVLSFQCRTQIVKNLHRRKLYSNEPDSHV